MKERENMNCGNQVAENGRKKKMWQPSCRNLGEEFFFRNKLWLICGNGTNEIKGKKNVAIDLWNGIAKIEGKKKWWQLICGNGIAKIGGKKKLWQ